MDKLQEEDKYFEPSDKFITKYGLPLAIAVVSLKEGKVLIMITNFEEKDVMLPKFIELGELQELDIVKNREEQTFFIQTDVERTVKQYPKIVIDNTNLTEKERNRLTDLIEDYSDVMSKDETDIGHSTILQHEIHLENEKPIKQRPYPVANALEAEQKR